MLHIKSIITIFAAVLTKYLKDRGRMSPILLPIYDDYEGTNTRYNNRKD